MSPHPLKASIIYNLSPRHSTEVPVSKSPGVYMKIYWLILEHKMEGQGTSGNFSGNISTARCHFFYTPPSIDACRSQFQLPPSTLLVMHALPLHFPEDPPNTICLPGLHYRAQDVFYIRPLLSRKGDIANRPNT